MYMRRTRLGCCRQTKTEELLSTSFHLQYCVSTSIVKVLLDRPFATLETIPVFIFRLLDESDSISFVPSHDAVLTKIPGIAQNFLLCLPSFSLLYSDWSIDFSPDPANPNMHERSADPGLYAAVC